VNSINKKESIKIDFFLCVLFKEKLIFSLQQPERKEHQKNQDASGSKQEACQEFLHWNKKGHVHCNQKVNDI
jgi:hypothetical protein